MPADTCEQQHMHGTQQHRRRTLETKNREDVMYVLHRLHAIARPRPAARGEGTISGGGELVVEMDEIDEEGECDGVGIVVIVKRNQSLGWFVRIRGRRSSVRIGSECLVWIVGILVVNHGSGTTSKPKKQIKVNRPSAEQETKRGAERESETKNVWWRLNNKENERSWRRL